MRSFLPPYTLGALVWTASMNFTGCVAEPSGNSRPGSSSGKGDSHGDCSDALASTIPDALRIIGNTELSAEGTLATTSRLADHFVEALSGDHLNLVRQRECIGISDEDLAKAVASLALHHFGEENRDFCPEADILTRDQLDFLIDSYDAAGARPPTYDPVEDKSGTLTLYAVKYCPEGLVNRPLGVLNDGAPFDLKNPPDPLYVSVESKRQPSHCFCGPPGLYFGSGDDGKTAAGDQLGSSCGAFCETNLDCAQKADRHRIWSVAAYANFLSLNEVKGAGGYPDQTLVDEYYQALASIRNNTKNPDRELSVPPKDPSYYCAPMTNHALGMCVPTEGGTAQMRACHRRYGLFYETTLSRSAAAVAALEQLWAGSVVGRKEYLPSSP